MPRVTVYHFAKYDITAGEVVLSPRPATLETIISCEGKLIEETAQQVDVSELDGDGFYTPKGGSVREDVDKVKHQDFGVTEKSEIGSNSKNRTSSPSDISSIEEGESLPAPLNTRLGNSSVSEQVRTAVQPPIIKLGLHLKYLGLYLILLPCRKYLEGRLYV